MWFNNIKTALLLALLSGLFMLLGGMMGGKSGLEIALICSLVMNGIIYFFSERIVLTMYGAQPLDRQEYGFVYEMVEKLAHKMQLPMPKLWLVKNDMANAFATGRSPRHASVAVTTGILALLEHHELRGVLAHELSHIKNRDVLIGTIAATIATAIGYMANMLHHVAFWTSLRHDDQEKKGNPLVMILVALLMPLAATLLQLAISRSREYLADETGSHESGDPLALASALEKLHNHIPQAHLDPQDSTKSTTASLFIVYPFSGPATWFSTHPPMHKRVARLRKLFEQLRYQS